MVGQIAVFCVAASASSTFIILSAAVSVAPCLKKPETVRTELPMRISVTQSRAAVCFWWCLSVSVSVMRALLSLLHQLLLSVPAPVRFLSEVAAREADGGRTWKSACHRYGRGACPASAISSVRLVGAISGLPLR